MNDEKKVYDERDPSEPMKPSNFLREFLYWVVGLCVVGMIPALMNEFETTAPFFRQQFRVWDLLALVIGFLILIALEHIRLLLFKILIAVRNDNRK